MTPELQSVLIFASGILLGSWLAFRTRNNASPLPTLPKREEKKPETPKVKLPSVKP